MNIDKRILSRILQKIKSDCLTISASYADDIWQKCAYHVIGDLHVNPPVHVSLRVQDLMIRVRVGVIVNAWQA